MTTFHYSLPSGQYVGALVSEDDAPPSTNYFTERDCVEVPTAPESTAWFWDFQAKCWYLPEEAKASQEREWRDAELASLTWQRDRHRDEVELGLPPTMPVPEFRSLLQYMQDLRDWPQSPSFPDPQYRPTLR